MNTLPRLFTNPSWETIATFSGSELAELAMLALLSAGILAAMCYGIYLAFRRQDRFH